MQKRFHFLFTIATLIGMIAIVFLSGCRKENLLTDSSADLRFSTDTLTFDTVFTTLGSTTLSFKVYNKHSRPINISSINLAGGQNSIFRINVDGLPGPAHQDVEILAKDSIYIFVEVTVEAGGPNTPFVLLDSVVFQTNGNQQRVILEAWGQDAYYHGVDSSDYKICDEVWMADKPHVILEGAIVDSGCTLTIEAGAQVFVGGDAPLIVYATATILVNGTQDNQVNFEGIRLETFFDDLPGQWSGIFILRGSTGNQFNYATINESSYGINLGSIPSVNDSALDFGTYFNGANAPSASLKNVTIKNSLFNALGGLLSIISAENCLFANSSDHIVSLAFGGLYDFTHCNITGYGSNTNNHEAAAVLVQNAIYVNQTPIPAQLEATFDNCIIYGSLDEELDTLNEAGGTFDVLFDHCLIKTERDSTNSLFSSSIINEDPLFTDRFEEDYTLTEDSPCRDSGKVTSVFIDIEGNPRDGMPDIGAYEFIP